MHANDNDNDNDLRYLDRMEVLHLWCTRMAEATAEGNCAWKCKSSKVLTVRS